MNCLGQIRSRTRAAVEGIVIRAHLLPHHHLERIELDDAVAVHLFDAQRPPVFGCIWCSAPWS